VYVTFSEYHLEGSVISGFRRGVNEISALLGYYAASNGSLLPMFRDNLSFTIFKGQAVLLVCHRRP
jgi:hypothetical protein